MPEVFADLGQAVQTFGGTDTPAMGTSETISVTGCTLPAVSFPATWCYVRDPVALSEQIQVTACTGPGATSITVTRGVNGTIPVAHATGYALVQDVSAQALTSFVQVSNAALTFVGSGTTLVNAALGTAFSLTLTASTTTLGNPSNPVDGQVIRFRITQGTGGSFTLAYGTAYDFGAAGVPVLSTAAGKVDILGFEYVASLGSWCYLGAGLGF